MLYQIAAVAGVAAAEGVQLQHVKPHGALYNMAARDRGAGRGDRPRGGGLRPSLILFGCPGPSSSAPAAPPACASPPRSSPIAPTRRTARSRRDSSPARSSTMPAAVASRAVRLVIETRRRPPSTADRAARGRHDLRPRRHAGRRRSSPPVCAPGSKPRASPSPRSDRHRSQLDC